MSFVKDTTRISKTGGALPNLQDYNQQYPDLLPKEFIDQVRMWDKQFPPEMETIFSRMDAPGWNFQWNVFIAPIEMAPFVEPNSNTPMVTSDAKYESFVCKQMKEGFWINSFELTHGLKGIIAMRTKQVMDALKLRVEYSLLQAALGNTWNGQNNARMTAVNAFNWALPNSTPLGDCLTIQMRVHQMAGQKPIYLWLDWTRELALPNHPAILNQLQYVDKTLLTNGMIPMLKGLAIKVIRGYYKEDAGEAAYIGAPGRGDVREDITPTSKRWLFDDVAMVTSAQVGRNARARGEHEGTRQWFDEDKDVVKYKNVQAFTPIVEDYARIGRIDWVATIGEADLYTSQGTTY